MDPNACFERFLTAVVDAQHEGNPEGISGESREAHADLCGWLRSGGFEPEWSAGFDRASFLAWGK